MSFGELRSLMHQEAREGAWCARLLELVEQAHQVDPDTYAQQWLPYLERFSGSWPSPLTVLDEVDALERWAARLPFATFGFAWREEHPSMRRVRRLLNSPACARLVALKFERCWMQRRVFEAVATASGLRNLRALTCTRCNVEHIHIVWLVASPHLPGIEHLDLSHNGIGPEAIEVLAASSLLSHLESLDLSGNPLGLQGAEALRASPTLPKSARVTL